MSTAPTPYLRLYTAIEQRRIADLAAGYGVSAEDYAWLLWRCAGGEPEEVALQELRIK